jgi:glycosyltransferase involved in cell wall biosynthesis
MNSLLKIACDISILGAGYINPKSRTGIFRVVQFLLPELASQESINLSMVTVNQQSNIWDEISSRLYIQSFESDLEPFFSTVYSSRFHLTSCYQTLIELQKNSVQRFVQNQPLLYKLSLAAKIPLAGVLKWDEKTHFRATKFDLYHSLYFPLPTHQELGSIPRILTVYDLIPILFPEYVTPSVGRQYRKAMHSIDRDRDWVICISEHTKQDFCNYSGMNPDRVFVTPLAAANFLQPVRDPSAIAAVLNHYNIRSPYLLSLATLEPRKNLSLLIRSFCQLVQQQPDLDLNLVLVGVSGWRNSDIFQAASQQPELRSRIKFTGYVPDADLSALYSGAIAFVYPSLYEGFGLPPLEAMQCGTPVITANTSSLPEVVSDAGIMVDPSQPDELSQALLNVAQNHPLRSELSERALQRAGQFSWKKCAQKTAQVYQHAVAHH